MQSKHVVFFASVSVALTLIISLKNPDLFMRVLSLCCLNIFNMPRSRSQSDRSKSNGKKAFIQIGIGIAVQEEMNVRSVRIRAVPLHWQNRSKSHSIRIERAF